MQKRKQNVHGTLLKNSFCPTGNAHRRGSPMRRGCEISVVGWLQIRAAACRGRCRSQPFATKERYGCGSAACRYTSARQNAPYFTGIFGEFVTSQWADRVVGPYGKASTAHVSRRGGRLCPPAGYTGFTAIFGEFATSQRADVGIGPYKGAPWAQGYAGPKGLRGFEHNKFSSTLISATDPLRHFLRK